ncbi:MAG: hypothetical protein KGH78_02525 [Candidatus Micrarchaeota archaeon]|nr:hypothetical protein [Candidatus Micrarchaeota archaeon]
MTPLNNGQFNRLLSDFSPYLGQSTNGSVVQEAVNLTVPYGTIKSGNHYLKAGTTHYAAYSLNNTLTYYIVNVQKKVPKLHARINGVDITRPNQTTTIRVPILPGQKTYNVSLKFSSSTNTTDSIPFTYNITKRDTKTGKGATILSSSINTNSVNKQVSLTSVPINQSLSVTFDTSGSANFTAVDPAVNVIPINMIFYVPITITNSQAFSIGDNFQQLVTADSATYQKYEAGNLMNVEFFYPNGIFVNAWLEGPASNTATATKYWLQLSNTIIANSKDTVFMGFGPLTQDLRSASGPYGVAPELTDPSYGVDDDGYVIFPSLYDNFNGVGTASSGKGNVPSTGIWNTVVTNNGFVDVNNGLTLSAGRNTVDDVHVPTLSTLQANILEANVVSMGANSVFGLAWSTNAPLVGNSVPKWGMGFHGQSIMLLYSNTVTTGFFKRGYYLYNVPANRINGGGANERNIANVIMANSVNLAPLPQVISFSSNAANVIGSNSYVESVVASNSFASTINGAFAELFFNNTNSVTIGWVRVRKFPPANVMPSVSFGQTIGIMNFTESGLPQNTPWNVVYNGALQWNAVAFPNSVIFETNTLASGAYSVNSQSGYVPTPSSGTATPGNTVSIAFALLASCAPVVSNTAITFPTTNPGSNSPSANVILVNDIGTANSNVWVQGTSWTYLSNTFNVGNTIWNPTISAAAAIGNALTGSAVDTGIVTVGTPDLTTGGGNDLFFGVNVPTNALPSVTGYSQTITISSSC